MISPACSMRWTSRARSRSRASRSAAQSLCISPRDIRSGPAPLSWEVRPPDFRPERRPAGLERAAAMEQNGMGPAVEDSMNSGYAVELRGNAARFARFRARWLGNDPSSFATIFRMLASTDMEDELRKLACPVLVIGAHVRSRPPAADRRRHRQIHSDCALCRIADRTFHGGSDTGIDRRYNRRVPEVRRRLTPTLESCRRYSSS